MNDIEKATPTKQAPSIKFSNKLVPLYEEYYLEPPTVEQLAIMQGYFYGVNKTLQNGNYSWDKVDIKKLSQTLIHYAKLGFDCQEDMLSFMPRTDKSTGIIQLVPVESVKGAYYKMRKFAYDNEMPEDVRVEIVYETDKFRPIKSSGNNTIKGDTYEFEITQPFERGKIVGAFGFLEYKNPSKNKLIFHSYKYIIEKYKPTYAKQEFWGKWENKMIEKTILKQLLKLVPNDPNKINQLRKTIDTINAIEICNMQEDMMSEIDNSANVGEIVDIVDDVVVNVEVSEEIEIVESTAIDIEDFD